MATTRTAPCDAGVVLDSADIDEFIITGTGGTDSLTISHGGNAAFDEDDDFTIDLEGGTDTLTITGSSGVDTVTLTPFAVNGSDITQADVENFTINTVGGADSVNGGTFAAALTINGGDEIG